MFYLQVKRLLTPLFIPERGAEELGCCVRSTKSTDTSLCDQTTDLQPAEVALQPQSIL